MGPPGSASGFTQAPPTGGRLMNYSERTTITEFFYINVNKPNTTRGQRKKKKKQDKNKNQDENKTKTKDLENGCICLDLKDFLPSLIVADYAG